MKRLFICVVGLVIAVTAWSRTFNSLELIPEVLNLVRS